MIKSTQTTTTIITKPTIIIKTIITKNNNKNINIVNIKSATTKIIRKTPTTTFELPTPV